MISYILTFGIHLIIAYTALWVWTADFRTVTTSYSGFNANIGGIIIPYARLATFGFALIVVVGLYLLLYKSEVGRAIQATAQDKEMARLMGVNIHQIYAITFGIGAAITGMAGSLDLHLLHHLSPDGTSLYDHCLLRGCSGRDGIYSGRPLGRADSGSGSIPHRHLSQCWACQGPSRLFCSSSC